MLNNVKRLNKICRFNYWVYLCGVINKNLKIFNMNTTNITPDLNYQIEEIKNNILILHPNKCYISMFKYEDSNWCLSLPIKTMYLSTLEDAIQQIESLKNDPNTSQYKCEYKIAKITN